MNDLPFIERLSIEGLKGAAGDYPLTRLNVVVGPNGAGKTRLADAISFLLGRDVAGENVDGRNLRQLLSGDRMRVRGIFAFTDRGNGALDVARIREVGAKGGFGESRLFVNNNEAEAAVEMAKYLGRTSAPGGSEWVDLSPEKVTAALALIGIALSPKAIDEALHAIREYSGGAADPAARPLRGRFNPPADPVAALELCTKTAKEELNAAREHKRGVAKSTDRSRVEVVVGIDPGIIEKRKGASSAAEQKAQRLAGELASARTRLDDANTRRQEHDSETQDVRDTIAACERREREAKARLEATPPAGPTQEAVAELQKKRDAASRDHATAAETHKRLEEGAVAAERALNAQDKKRIESTLDAKQAAANLADAERRAGLMKSVPCATSGCWIDADEIPPDDGPTQNDLAATCPLLAEARTAQNQIPELRAAAARAKERNDGDIDKKVDRAAALRLARDERDEALVAANKLLKAYDDARVAFEAAVKEQRAAADMAEARGKATSDIEAARADAARWREKLESHLLQIDQIAATIDEAQVAVDSASEAYEAAKAEAASASTALGEATEQHTKHERYTKDRMDEAAAEKRETAAKKLLEDIEEVQAKVMKQGQAAITDRAARFIAAPWSLAFDNGRVGLSDGREFWSGPGLSAAQRAIVSMALDAALDDLQSRRLRIVHLEVDQLDHAARARALGELRQAVDDGKVGQVFVMLWRPDDLDQPYFSGFNVVRIRSARDADAVQPKTTTDFDPFADEPPAVLKPSELKPDDDGFDPFADDPAPTPPAAEDPMAEVRSIIGGLPGPAVSALLRSMGVAGVPKNVDTRRQKAEAEAIRLGLDAPALVSRIAELARGQAQGEAEGGDDA